MPCADSNPPGRTGSTPPDRPGTAVYHNRASLLKSGSTKNESMRSRAGRVAGLSSSSREPRASPQFPSFFCVGRVMSPRSLTSPGPTCTPSRIGREVMSTWLGEWPSASVFHARDQAADAESALTVHRRLAVEHAPLRIEPSSSRAEDLDVGPGFPVFVDDPADHGAPGKEFHGEVVFLVALQVDRSGELAALVEEVESVWSRGHAVDDERRGVHGVCWGPWKTSSVRISTPPRIG